MDYKEEAELFRDMVLAAARSHIAAGVEPDLAAHRADTMTALEAVGQVTVELAQKQVPAAVVAMALDYYMRAMQKQLHEVANGR